MAADNQLAIPGISSALDVPVMHVVKKEESARFQEVAKRNSSLVPMDGEAFCSRRESTTVVIGVSTSRLFGLFGLSCLFG